MRERSSRKDYSIFFPAGEGAEKHGKEGLPPLRLGAAEAVPEKKGWMDHSSLVSPTKRATMWNPARL